MCIVIVENRFDEEILVMLCIKINIKVSNCRFN